MPFIKLNREIQKILTRLELTTPTSFQTKSIPVIKSGANVYCIAPKDSGKTTTLILTTLQELKCREMGNAPRAIVLVEDPEKAKEMYDAFLVYTKETSLRVYLGHEEMHIDVQKSEIAMGVDILISTAKSMNKLFLSNGLSTSDLKILSVDDAEFLAEKLSYSAIMSITRSIPRCQYVLYLEKMDPMIKRFEHHFMVYPKVVKI